MAQIHKSIENTLGKRPEYRAFRRGEMPRSEYTRWMVRNEHKLLRPGVELDRDMLHLSSRFPRDEETFVGNILNDLKSRGVIATTDYPKADFAHFRATVEARFDHFGYRTYIFPEEERLLYALSWVLAPRRTVFLGSYFGYWAVWALPGIQASRGTALLIDVDPVATGACQQNLKRLGFSHFTWVVAADAVRFIDEIDEGLDLAILDAEGDPCDERENYRDKAIYYPLTEPLIPKLAADGVLVCHNMLLRHADENPYFAAKIDWYRAQYARFLPLIASSFAVTADYETTEGVGVYAKPRIRPAAMTKRPSILSVGC